MTNCVTLSEVKKREEKNRTRMKPMTADKETALSEGFFFGSAKIRFIRVHPRSIPSDG